MATLGKKLVVGGALVLASMVAGKLVSTIQSIVVARLLGPQDLGLWVILQQIQGLAGLFATLGIQVAMTKYVAEYNVADRKLCAEVIGTGLMVILIGSVSIFGLLSFWSSGIALVYGVQSMSFLVVVLSLSISGTALATLGFSIIQGFQEMKTFAQLSIAQTLILAVATISLTRLLGIVGTVLATVVVSFTSLVLVGLFSRKAVSSHLGLTVRLGFGHARQILKYSLPVLLTWVISIVVQLFGGSYLAFSHSFGDVGLYKVVDVLSASLIYIPTALAVPLFPLVSELSTLDVVKMRGTVSAAIKFTSLLLVPSTLALGLFSPEIILIFLGPAYLSRAALGGLGFLLLKYGFASLTVLLVNLLQAVGRTKDLLKSQVVYSISYVPLVFVLVKPYGLLGLAAVDLVSYVLQAGALLVFSRSHLSQRTSKLFLAPLACLPVFLVPYLAWDFSYYLISGLISGGAAIVTLWSMLSDDQLSSVTRWIWTEMLKRLRGLSRRPVRPS